MTQITLPLAPDLNDSEILWSDEPEMESSLHYWQLLLLVTCLEWYWRDRQDYFIGADLTIYYSPDKIKNRDFRGPDFFVVKGVSRQPRPSWVVWQEGDRYPNVIIELLSDSTKKVDKTTKKDLYQNVFQTPEYFWFSPDSLEFMGYRLIKGQYTEIPLTSDHQRWSEELQLYLGIVDRQLRYFTPEGALILTLPETALQEQQIAQEATRQAQVATQQAIQQAQAAQTLAQQEKERADRLANYLQSLGIDPDQIAP